MDTAMAASHWSDRMLADVTEPLAAGALRSGSLLCAGASEAELVAAEQRLGVTLPASYRQFLKFSDGAYADWELVAAAWPRNSTSDPDLGLLPARDLRATVDAVREVVDIWTDVAPDLRDCYPGRPHRNREVVWAFEPLADSVLISSLTSEAGKYFLCLAPSGSHDADSETFELWDKGHDEITRFLSFADWLELSVADRWYDPGPVYLRINADIDPGFIDEQLSWPTSLRVHQIRRLVPARSSPKLPGVLDSLWAETDHFVRLAAAQVHRIVTDQDDRLRELVDCDEASVALSATASLRVLADPNCA